MEKNETGSSKALTHSNFIKQVNKSLVGELYHQHLIIKAFVQNPPRESSVLEQWLTEVVDKIKMRIVIGPFSKYVSACGNSGLTGIVVIETSHIAIHIWDEPVPAMVQMDCYSCSKYDPEIIIESLKAFGLVSYEKLLIDRNENFQINGSLVKESL